MSVRKSLFGAVLLAVAGAPFASPAAGAEPKKVLMLSISHGFQHPVVGRKGEELSMAEKIVIELGKKNGFEVTASKDGSVINAENLKKYDAVFFFTQGNLDEPNRLKLNDVPVKKEHRQSILDYIKEGGGFVGTHCGGADTFHNWPDFLEMVGGEFIGHGAQQESKVQVVDPDFPAVKGWPRNFTITDEWYAYKGFNNRMHVLMMLETEGMKGRDYQRPSYPITWCSQYGKGRVFYTGMGHREDVWENELYQSMIAKAVLWALQVEKEGDAEPNLKKLFGDEEKALVRINPPKK